MHSSLFRWEINLDQLKRSESRKKEVITVNKWLPSELEDGLLGQCLLQAWTAACTVIFLVQAWVSVSKNQF